MPGHQAGTKAHPGEFAGLHWPPAERLLLWHAGAFCLA